MLTPRSALILIDIQNDFMPEGALAVPQADIIVPIANRVQRYFKLIIASQDWHPINHASFAANQPGRQPGDSININGLAQVLWPVHCVQDTVGAAFVASLDSTRISKIIYKGTHPEIDSYSIFFDNAHQQKTQLDSYLKQQQVTDIYLLGLATDYCVKYSVLDGCALGYRVFVVSDGCRGINLHSEDSSQAFASMQSAGGQFITSHQIKDAIR